MLDHIQQHRRRNSGVEEVEVVVRPKYSADWKSGFAGQDIQVNVASVWRCSSLWSGDSRYIEQTSTCHQLCGVSISCSSGIIQYGMSLTRSSVFNVRTMHVLICCSAHLEASVGDQRFWERCRRVFQTVITMSKD